MFFCGCAPAERKASRGSPASRRPKPIHRRLRSDPCLWLTSGKPDWRVCSAEAEGDLGRALANGDLLVFRAARKREWSGSFSTNTSSSPTEAAEAPQRNLWEARRVALAPLGDSADDDYARWALAFRALAATHPRTAAIAMLRLRRRAVRCVWAP